MIVKLLTEHHLELLNFKGGCRGSSESTHSKCHIVGNLTHWLLPYCSFEGSFKIEDHSAEDLASLSTYPPTVVTVRV